MQRFASWTLAAALVWSTPSLAQTDTPTSGTYMLQGGSYSISLEMDGGSLVVHEPNKDTVYDRKPDGGFQAYNPDTETTYGIRVIDGRTIEAYKPNVSGNEPSRLLLISSAASSGEEVSTEESEKWSALADSYMERTQSDPTNVQSWTACGAVAMKRSIATKEDADAYAQQMAEMLKQMDASSSPCPEVFTF